MFSIAVDLICGQFRGSEYNNREEAEWPPHPARLYSALLAASSDVYKMTSKEKDVLDWLATLPPPKIFASECSRRSTLDNYVPVNDVSSVGLKTYMKDAAELDLIANSQNTEKKEADKARKRCSTILKKHSKKVGIEQTSALLPENRPKQPRHFPSVTPYVPCVEYIWDETLPQDTNKVLDEMAERIVRLGHSASLVSAYVKTKEFAEPTYLPEEGHREGSYPIRWVSKGQREALENAYQQHLGTEPRGSLPHRNINYNHVSSLSGEAVSSISPITAGEMLVFEFAAGNRLCSSVRSAEIASTLKKALMSHMSPNIPPAVSGHAASGSSAPPCRAGFIALPWVDHLRADGRLLGCAVTIPKGMSNGDASAISLAVGKWEQGGKMFLMLGNNGKIGISRVKSMPHTRTLQTNTWSRPSSKWVSATPVALPFHPQGKLGKGTETARRKAWEKAEKAIEKSCEHISLPPLKNMSLGLSPFLHGSRHARDYPPFIQGHGAGSRARILLHAFLEFSQPVAGPVLLGSGRYLGLGLMYPLPSGGN